MLAPVRMRTWNPKLFLVALFCAVGVTAMARAVPSCSTFVITLSPHIRVSNRDNYRNPVAELLLKVCKYLVALFLLELWIA